MKHTFIRITVATAATFTCSAQAQNVGGVFPPFVTEGHSSAEYRFAFTPGEDGAPDRMAHRLHYQRAINDDFMWRLVGQISGPTENQDLDLLQAELFWEISEDDAPWRTGLRFDVTLREGSAPEQIQLNWTNHFRLSERWSARAILLNQVQFGDQGNDGIGFETRASLAYRADSGVVLGVETFNLHGTTEDFNAFGGRQQIGPFAFWPLADDWRLFTGVLFGANDVSPDTDLRLWLTKTF